MTEPRTFWHEFEECLDDVSTDLQQSVMDFDPEVMMRVRAATLEMLRRADGDGEKAISDLVSMNIWLFLTGREHAARGYAPPVNRTNDDPGLPDTVEDMFKEN